MTTILLVEDNERHIAEARSYFRSVKVDLLIARNAKEAAAILPVCAGGRTYFGKDKVFLHGVITDVFFPKDEHSDPEPIGVAIMAKCQRMGIPCVLCTDGHHHGSHLDWIDNLIEAMGWPRLVDSDFLTEEERARSELPKAWTKALDLLLQ